MGDDLLLSMRGIDKRFAGIPALTEASLQVKPGEVHALIGQNGAGKSTLIKVLTGYHRRDAGEVLFQGRPFEVASPLGLNGSGFAVEVFTRLVGSVRRGWEYSPTFTFEGDGGYAKVSEAHFAAPNGELSSPSSGSSANRIALSAVSSPSAIGPFSPILWPTPNLLPVPNT